MSTDEQAAVARLIEPERLVRAAPGHGVNATRSPEGGTIVSCCKPVEENARAMLLLVPGFARVDASPTEDSLGLLVRPLVPEGNVFGRSVMTQRGWSASDELPPQKSGPVPGEIAFYAEFGATPLLGTVVVFSHRQRQVGVSHLLVQAYLRIVEPGSIKLS